LLAHQAALEEGVGCGSQAGGSSRVVTGAGLSYRR